MREIIFRGKMIDNGLWGYGHHIMVDDQFCADVERKKHFICVFDGEDVLKREVIPETVGQYAGLADKNGKNIFEGDIVETNIVTLLNNYVPLRGTVIFENGAFGIRTKRGFTAFACFCNTTFEVVGNIHNAK